MPLVDVHDLVNLIPWHKNGKTYYATFGPYMLRARDNGWFCVSIYRPDGSDTVIRKGRPGDDLYEAKRWAEFWLQTIFRESIRKLNQGALHVSEDALLDRPAKQRS